MNPRALLRAAAPDDASVQTRIDNAVRAAEGRDERRLQVAVGELHDGTGHGGRHAARAARRAAGELGGNSTS